MNLTLRMMTDGETRHYIAVGLDAYVAKQAADSGESEADVRRKAEEQYVAYFPGGHPAPGHRLLVLESDGEPVGKIWAGPHPTCPETSELAWLYNIEVDEDLRGRGYGRAGLELVETHLAREGVAELGLNVMVGNDAAQRRYTAAE